jgi:hypothetical protein
VHPQLDCFIFFQPLRELVVIPCLHTKVQDKKSEIGVLKNKVGCRFPGRGDQDNSARRSLRKEMLLYEKFNGHQPLTTADDFLMTVLT